MMVIRDIIKKYSIMKEESPSLHINLSVSVVFKNHSINDDNTRFLLNLLILPIIEDINSARDP